MAVIYMDGCDLYNSTTDLRDAGVDGYITYFGNKMGYSASGGRFGFGALVPDLSTVANYIVPFPPVALGTDLYVGFWFKSTLSGTTGFQTLIQLYTTNGWRTAIKLSHDQNGTLRVEENDGTTHDTASGVLTANTWSWIELKVTLGTNNTNGAYDLHVDTTSVSSDASSDTFPSTGDTVGELRIVGSDYTRYIDDIVIWTGSGASPTSFMGYAQIDTLLPTGDGADTAWTASAGSDYQCVDDALAGADGDTTYISASSASTKSSFAMADLTGVATSNLAVQVRARAKKTASEVKTLRGYVKSSASTTNGVTRGMMDNYAVHRLGIVSADPNGGGAWTESSINAMQAGVEVIA